MKAGWVQMEKRETYVNIIQHRQVLIKRLLHRQVPRVDTGFVRGHEGEETGEVQKDSDRERTWERHTHTKQRGRLDTK